MRPLFLWEDKTILLRVATVCLVLSVASIFFQIRVPLLQSIAHAGDVSTVHYDRAQYATKNKLTVAAVAPIQEVNIANNGLVLLRGARVVSISGNTIQVMSTWGATSLTWNLVTMTQTQFLNTKGERVSETDLLVGDTITATGSIINSDQWPSIQVQFLRL